MVKLGNFTFNMGDFTEFAKLFLGEAAKYVLLLLFAILAIRLWRRSVKLSGENRRINSLFAAAASVISRAPFGLILSCTWIRNCPYGTPELRNRANARRLRHSPVFSVT